MLSSRPSVSFAWPVLAACLALLSAGCNTDVAVLVDGGVLVLRISVNPDDLVLVIGGEAKTVEVTVRRGEDTGAVNLTLSGVPAGVITRVRHPGMTTQGSVTFRATSSASPVQGVEVTITASDGTSFDTDTITLSVVP